MNRATDGPRKEAMRRLEAPALLLSLLLAAPLAAASTPDEVEEDAVGEELQTEVSPPPEQNFQGILYRTGGAGSGEREALQTACRVYSLKMIFARKGESDFVAGVSVKISDAKGKKIFEAADTGPWLFVDLPKGGRYRVAATSNGQTQEQTV